MNESLSEHNQEVKISCQLRECSSSSALSIYYQNVRGLNSKTVTFFNSAASCDFDLIAIAETWLHDGLGNNELFNQTYTVFRKDRNFCCSNKSRGGGVLLAVKTTLFSQQINLSNTPLDSLHLVEVVAVRVSSMLSNFNTIVLVIYFPPSLTVEYFRSVVDALLTLDSLNSSNLLILGDFNLPEFVNIKQSVQPSAKMIAMSQLIEFFNLKQFNKIPNVNGKCLDLVLSNVRDSDVVVTASNYPLVDEDHYHPSLCLSMV